jgi:uncharacterized protein (TIGR00297 family)
MWSILWFSLAGGTESWGAVAIGVGVTLVLAAVAAWQQVLTVSGATVAGGFGVVIVLLAGVPYVSLLILFVVGASLATRYRFEEKRRRKVGEGTRGERGVQNVLSHIVVPLALVALVPFRFPLATSGVAPFAYTAALATGAADTFASEMGVLAGRAYNILGGGPVRPGTNGGISLQGEAWALIAAGIMAGVGWVSFRVSNLPVPSIPWLWVGLAASLGWIGCQVDSLVGATLENRGYLGKGGTNFLAMLGTALLAVGLAYAIGL